MLLLLINLPLLQNQNIQPIRLSSYLSSPRIQDVGEVNVKYAVTNNPEEWKYVERILPPQTVPQPVKKDSYPSGWKPQGENFRDYKYFVERTKNHMIPVYLKIEMRNTRRQTFVRRIHGDIFALEAELRKFLQKESLQPIRSQVNEFCGYIRINGDHVNAIKYWLEKKNF